MPKADSNAEKSAAEGQQQKPVNVNQRSTDCYDHWRRCFHYEKAVCSGKNAYTGSRHYTLGGLKCHDWSSVGKHRKEGWPKNYCRNPSNSAGPWCYAENGWDYCFTGCKNGNCYESSRDCFHYGKAGCLKMSSYIGLRSYSINGARCQPWKSHSHDLAGNLCRDPFGGVKGPFCYTNPNTEEWNYCFKDCNAAKCFNSKHQCFHFGKKGCMEPHSYIGDKSTIIDGTKCQKWSSHNIDLPKNYCRLHYGGLKSPWCYTGPGEGATDWSYCFPDCDSGCYDSRRNCFHYERAVCSHKDAYIGTRDDTLGGLKCHDWSTHGRHGYTMNYCRNSGKSIGPWCYADNGWDFCFTGCNNENCYDSSRDCFHYGKPGCLKMSSYIGPRNYSINGAPCQPWKSHSHHLAGNLCRDPYGGLKGPFCYTNPNTKDWNYCFKDCNAAKCLELDNKHQCFHFGKKGCMKPYSYIGDKDTTIDGTKCQKWSSHNTELPNNYCRLHYGGLKSPWCYTGPGETDWSYCFPDCNLEHFKHSHECGTFSTKAACKNKSKKCHVYSEPERGHWVDGRCQARSGGRYRCVCH